MLPLRNQWSNFLAKCTDDKGNERLGILFYYEVLKNRLDMCFMHNNYYCFDPTPHLFQHVHHI